MKRSIRLSLAIALPLALIAGCKAPGTALTDGSAADVSAFQKPASLFADAGKVLSAVSPNGLANVRVNMRVRQLETPGFKVQALPTLWDEATVSLFSERANRTYNADKHSVTAQFGDFTSDANGYNSDVFSGGYVGPYGVAGDSHDNIFVADSWSKNLYKVDRYGKKTVLADDLFATWGLAVDSEDNLYVGNSNSLYKFTPDGTRSIVATGFTLASGVAIDSHDTIYVAEADAGRITKVDGEGNKHPFASGFKQIVSIAMNSRDELFVSRQPIDDNSLIDSGVYRLDTEGNATKLPLKLGLPGGLYVDAQDQMFLSDWETGALYTFDREGQNQTQFAGGLNFPLGLWRDSKGNFYAANFGTVNVVKLSPMVSEFRKTFKFPPLRPSDDYTARVYMKTVDKQQVELAGSQEISQFALRPGANTLEFVVVVNGDRMNYQMLTSANGNQVDGNAITVGDEVTLATGMMKNQPGVSHLKVYLKGACYNYDGGPEVPVLIGVLNSPDTWDTFTWNSAADAMLKATKGTTLFQHDKFIGGIPEEADADQFPTRDGQIMVVAVNDRGEELSHVAIPIKVYGAPEVDVILK